MYIITYFLMYFIFSTYVFFDFFFYSSPKGLVFKVLVYMLRIKLRICIKYIWIFYFFLFSGNIIGAIFYLVIVHRTTYICLIFKLHLLFCITNLFMCIACIRCENLKYIICDFRHFWFAFHGCAKKYHILLTKSLFTMKGK